MITKNLKCISDTIFNMQNIAYWETAIVNLVEMLKLESQPNSHNCICILTKLCLLSRTKIYVVTLHSSDPIYLITNYRNFWYWKKKVQNVSSVVTTLERAWAVCLRMMLKLTEMTTKKLPKHGETLLRMQTRRLKQYDFDMKRHFHLIN